MKKTTVLGKKQTKKMIEMRVTIFTTFLSLKEVVSSVFLSGGTDVCRHFALSFSLKIKMTEVTRTVTREKVDRITL